jgi:hypothetical protein
MGVPVAAFQRRNHHQSRSPNRNRRRRPTVTRNYTGACVPIASDVECAGGSGNGPEYVEGPVTVVGEDIYGLDTDDPRPCRLREHSIWR